MENNQSDNIKPIDEQIVVTLTNAPVITGCSIQQVANVTGLSWPTAKKHLGLLEDKGIVQHSQIGRAKLYKLSSGKTTNKQK